MSFVSNAVFDVPYRAEAFDENGFIIDENIWTKEIAAQIAFCEGIDDLSDKHWAVIDTLRSKYQTLGGMPSMRTVCKTSGIAKLEIYTLFGNCLSVWKIAGLSDPGEEARNYMQ